jgi:pimeloyl-ACP methyl ester carboxylesterase
MTNVNIATEDGISLAASQWGERPALVFLHAGVADRRSWFGVMEHLDHAALAYDMPGFGDTPPASQPFSRVAHLAAVVDHLDERPPVVLVGNSQGGLLAIDFALTNPNRVAGLVLIAPAVSGAPELDWESELGPEIFMAAELAEDAEDLDEVNRLEAWIWLDGPGQPEGRVAGAARDLVLDMNRIALTGDLTGASPVADVDPAWDRLEQLTTPVLVIMGEHDLPGVNERSAAVARRTPHARLVELPGVAHLPGIEQPAAVAREIDRFISSLS